MLPEQKNEETHSKQVSSFCVWRLLSAKRCPILLKASTELSPQAPWRLLTKSLSHAPRRLRTNGPSHAPWRFKTYESRPMCNDLSTPNTPLQYFSSLFKVLRKYNTVKLETDNHFTRTDMLDRSPFPSPTAEVALPCPAASASRLSSNRSRTVSPPFGDQSFTSKSNFTTIFSV